MAYSDHIQPLQLKMFMRPAEVKAAYYPGDVDEETPGLKTEQQVWKTKSKRNARPWTDESGKTTNFTNMIREQGVHEPIDVITEKPQYAGDNSLENGHHRVQAAEEAEKKTGREYYLPVRHWPG